MILNRQKYINYIIVSCMSCTGTEKNVNKRSRGGQQPGVLKFTWNCSVEPAISVRGIHLEIQSQNLILMTEIWRVQYYSSTKPEGAIIS